MKRLNPKPSQNSISLCNPKTSWQHGFPSGNGKLGAMLHGDSKRMVLTVNDELLYGGGLVHDWDKRVDFPDPRLHNQFKKARRLLRNGNYSRAQAGEGGHFRIVMDQFGWSL